MNTYPKFREPFAFWLIKHFLKSEKERNENTRPVSNHELFIVLGMIISALAVLRIIFQ